MARMARKFDPGYSFRSSDFRGHPERTRHAGEEGRPCARGEYCGSYELVTEDGKTRREPARSYQPFCPKDRRCIETDLRQLPGQFVLLAAEIGRPAGSGQAVRVPFGPRIPLRVDVDTLMRAIAESLCSWHERVAQAADLSYPSTTLDPLRRDAIAVRDASRALAERVDALLALPPAPMGRNVPLETEAVPGGDGKVRRVLLIAEAGRWEGLAEGTLGKRRVHRDAGWADVIADLDGADAGTEIFTLRYLCRAVLGETRAKPEELLGVPCRQWEECGRMSLRRAELPSDPDAPVWWSECSECGDRLTEEEYREWTGLCAAYERNRRKEPATLENLPGVA